MTSLCVRCSVPHKKFSLERERLAAVQQSQDVEDRGMRRDDAHGRIVAPRILHASRTRRIERAAVRSPHSLRVEAVEDAVVLDDHEPVTPERVD